MNDPLAKPLAKKYVAMNPEEFKGRPIDWTDLERIFNNWIERLRKKPENALAVGAGNWCGKVTRAYFAMFGAKCPKKKADIVTGAIALIDTPPLRDEHPDCGQDNEAAYQAAINKG
jgi:hypothetical protein